MLSRLVIHLPELGCELLNVSIFISAMTMGASVNAQSTLPRCNWLAESTSTGLVRQSQIGFGDALQQLAEAELAIGIEPPSTLTLDGTAIFPGAFYSAEIYMTATSPIQPGYPGYPGTQQNANNDPVTGGVGPGAIPCTYGQKIILTSSLPQSCKRKQNDQAGLSAGDPINPVTGEQALEETDYLDPGMDPIHIVRSYSSQGGLSAPYTVGVGWNINILGATMIRGDSSVVYFNIADGDSRVPAFYWNGTQGWQSLSGNTDTLQVNFGNAADGTAILQEGNSGPTWTFDINNPLYGVIWSAGFNQPPQPSPQQVFSIGNAAGTWGVFPTQKILANGYVHTYGASGSGQLTLTNNVGRITTMVFNGIQLSQIILPNGNSIYYTYDSSYRLTGVRYPDGTSKSYVYENVSFPYLLTGIYDQNGNRYATYAYDSNGYAIQSQLAGGVFNYEVNYPASLGSSATVTDPLGMTRSYTYGVQGGRVAVLSSSQMSEDRTLVERTKHPESLILADSHSRTQFAGNGLVYLETDFNGNYMIHHWDTTNAQLQSVQSSGRTTSFAWGAPNGRPSQIAGPGQIQSYVYNGFADPTNGGAPLTCGGSLNSTVLAGSNAPVLCKRIIQATTDTTGSNGLSSTIDATVPTRVWSFTYNDFNEVLTETDPLNNTTRYSYSALGVLQSVTNALNQTTQFTQWDAAGAVLQAIDPNGVPTNFTYDALERLTSVSTAGQTTSYTYNPVGDISVITKPDGSTVTYTYDPSHRLTNIADSLGNQVTYTLDNMGNRVATQLSGPSGATLQSAQSFNSLNLLQQATGAQ